MSENKHIDLESIKEDIINVEDFNKNIVPDDSIELSIPQDSTTELLTEDTSLGNNSKGKGRTTSAVWEYMDKTYNDMKQVVAIICSLCKKKYEPKTST